MALNDHDQASIRHYLLGNLSDDEQEKIEERLMVEDDLFQELEISKGELIEEYRAGELTQNEHRWFEQHFLASPEGRQRHAFANAIECLESLDRAPVHAKPAPQRVTFQEKLQAFFRNPRFATATLAGVAVIVVLLLIPRGPEKFVAANLTSSAVPTRGIDNDKYTRITVPADVSELRISLALPQPATPGTNYRVQLNNRHEIKNLEPSGNDKNSVLVVIPKGQVPPGYYALTLQEIKADGTEQPVPGYYFFFIE